MKSALSMAPIGETVSPVLITGTREPGQKDLKVYVFARDNTWYAQAPVVYYDAGTPGHDQDDWECIVHLGDLTSPDRTKYMVRVIRGDKTDLGIPSLKPRYRYRNATLRTASNIECP